MGFKLPKGIKVSFDDCPREELRGMEMTVRRISVEEQFSMDDLRADIKEDATKEEQKEAVGAFIDFVVGKIVDWNLENEDDEPIPVSGAVLRQQDLGFMFVIVDQWQRKLAGVSAPLNQPSSDGEQFPERFLPMD